MNPSELLARRARLARQKANFETLESLAKAVEKVTRTKVSTTHILGIEDGSICASGFLNHIAITCGVRPEWLTYGEEPMTEGGTVSDLAIQDGLTRHERKLLRDYRLLPPNLQEHFSEIVAATALPLDPRYQEWEEERRKEALKRSLDDFDDVG